MDKVNQITFDNNLKASGAFLFILAMFLIVVVASLKILIVYSEHSRMIHLDPELWECTKKDTVQVGKTMHDVTTICTNRRLKL